MTDITEGGVSSYDLSEASSDISTGSQDTDRHSNVTITTTTTNNNSSSNNSRNHNNVYQRDEGDFFIQEEKDVYPTLLFSRGGMGGDPLPVVKEDKILRDIEDQEDDFVEQSFDMVAVNSTEEEEQEFTREMNTTKIAFSAYRNAVLHLVHHQPSRKSAAAAADADGGREEKSTGDAGEQSVSSVADTEVDANHRMTILEEMAKRLVETKAKACFEAVEVANEFMERRMERMRGRNALFVELLNAKVKSQNSVNNKVGTRHGANSIHARKEGEKKVSTSAERSSQNFVRIRKFTRHPQCILATLPPFQFQPSRSNNDQQHHNSRSNNNDDDDDAETPASYGTTSWISDMVRWRKQRQIHKIYCFKKCGCPDCSLRLKEIQSQ